MEPAGAQHSPKSQLRSRLRAELAAVPPELRHRRSVALTALLTATPEFKAANVVMIFIAMAGEVDTTSIALRCWQAGKTVVAPRVGWEQRRITPVEINSLDDQTIAPVQHRPGVLTHEPRGGNPIPVDMIDFVLVPGIAFSPTGYRLGRGMGFYDRFLAQPAFDGVSCGLAFDLQIVADMPTQPHDIPMSMLVTETQTRRFAAYCMEA